MKKIEAYIQPFMLRKVEEALRAIHIHGMSVIDARGFGKEKDEHCTTKIEMSGFYQFRNVLFYVMPPLSYLIFSMGETLAACTEFSYAIVSSEPLSLVCLRFAYT